MSEVDMEQIKENTTKETTSPEKADPLLEQYLARFNSDNESFKNTVSTALTTAEKKAKVGDKVPLRFGVPEKTYKFENGKWSDTPTEFYGSNKQLVEDIKADKAVMTDSIPDLILSSEGVSRIPYLDGRNLLTEKVGQLVNADEVRKVLKITPTLPNEIAQFIEKNPKNAATLRLTKALENYNTKISDTEEGFNLGAQKTLQNEVFSAFGNNQSNFPQPLKNAYSKDTTPEIALTPTQYKTYLDAWKNKRRQENKEEKYSNQEIIESLSTTIKNHAKQAINAATEHGVDFFKLTPMQQAVYVDAAFNMGEKKLKQFSQTFNIALAKGGKEAIKHRQKSPGSYGYQSDPSYLRATRNFLSAFRGPTEESKYKLGPPVAPLTTLPPYKLPSTYLGTPTPPPSSQPKKSKKPLSQNASSFQNTYSALGRTSDLNFPTYSFLNKKDEEDEDSEDQMFAQSSDSEELEEKSPEDFYKKLESYLPKSEQTSLMASQESEDEEEDEEEEDFLAPRKSRFSGLRKIIS